MKSRSMQWARYHPQGYECSSRGDQRFSALFAKLSDGRTIEQAYQLDVKGYRVEGDDWKLGKGKPAINGKTREELWSEYLGLWRQWVRENPALLTELRMLSVDKVLTDQFATSPINQAHALSDLINEAEARERLPFTF